MCSRQAIKNYTQPFHNTHGEFILGITAETKRPLNKKKIYNNCALSIHPLIPETISPDRLQYLTEHIAATSAGILLYCLGMIRKSPISIDGLCFSKKYSACVLHVNMEFMQQKPE